MEKMIKTERVKLRVYSNDDKEYWELREFIKYKACDYYKHEINKQKEKGEEIKASFWATGTLNNYGFFNYEGEHICFAANNLFIRMMSYQYMQAFHRYPENFGTKDAEDVVDALYKNDRFDGTNWDRQKFIDIALKYENFCYVVRKKDGKFEDRVLRIDLFRLFELEKTRKQEYEFTGGLFHALKHFQLDGKSLSTETGYDVESLDEVMLMCVLAFFQPEIPERKDCVSMILPVSEEKWCKAVYYHEKESNVYCLTTMYVEDNK